MNILVYIPSISSRARYIFNLIFRDILLIHPEFTSQKEEFLSFEGIKLTYADSPLGDELFFRASPLLSETGIKPVSPEIKKDLYPGADPFAFAFFLVSRYEEYLPHKRDANDRYDVRGSVAFENNFLGTPVINHWAGKIKAMIAEKYPQAVFPEQHYRFIPTIDVDNAYAYREKGFVRTFGAFSRSLLKFNFGDISTRSNVLLGKENDPYDVFEYLINIQKNSGINPIYFFLLADYGLNDKNVPHTSRKFQALIKSVSDYAEVGIHPSYNSSNDRQRLKTEISRLTNVLHKDITKSRQHFLKIHLPETYRNLIQLGITDDYTMGYSTDPGFRAGICTPFNFYDLAGETETSLKIHPFCLMEATLKYYKNIPPENAFEHMKPVIDDVKKVKGSLYTIWHNEFLSNVNEFEGWRKVFEEMVAYAV